MTDIERDKLMEACEACVANANRYDMLDRLFNHMIEKYVSKSKSWTYTTVRHSLEKMIKTETK